MGYKIESITFKNFKFFYGCDDNEETNKLVLGKKHLLLYGENGSGKSSIYWALYTMLQSSIKSEDNDVIKYFDAADPQNLRNRFAIDNEESGISICLNDNKNRQLTWEISDSNVNTINDPIIKKTLLSSDFINYKYLAKIYDFRNSETLDLFSLFERDLFQHIDLEEEYTDVSGTLLPNNTFASEWWDNITKTPSRLPRNKRIVSVSSSEYKNFKERILPRFYDLLKRYLNRITEGANAYLEKEFKCPFRIKFDNSKLICDYNKAIGPRAKDGRIHKPQILLELTYIHDSLDTSKNKIVKPHIFLNEARLTAVALSIRLAMLNEKLKNSGGGKILVLDDLLVSLDMSNRDVVLDILLKQASVFQLIILTHDRAFYNIAKLRITSSDLDDSWVFKEMYHKQHDNTDIPRPIIVNPKSYLSCAEKYLNLFDYPACANYLRKECERVMSYLLPENLRIAITDEESKLLPLERLINNFKSLCQTISLDFMPYEKLMEHKNILLNPLSHDNITSPIYKQELLSTVHILLALNNLKKVIIANVNGNDYLILKLTDDNHEEWQYKLLVQETFFALKDDNDNLYFNNPLTHFVWRQNSNVGELLNKSVKLRNGLNNIKHALTLSHEIDIMSCCYNVEDKTLNEII